MQENRYEKYFSDWLFENLPKSSEGQLITDIDYFIGDYNTKKFFLVELKTRGNDIANWQKSIYSLINKRLMLTNGSDGRTYMGVNLVKFENTNFYDGKVWLNGQEIDEFGLLEAFFIKLGLDTNKLVYG